MSEIVLAEDVRVELVKSSASDDDVIWAARVSTLGEQAAIEVPEARRKGLIRYLMKNRHGSPFEHTSMTFRISGPIFAFREFHRHRVGWSYNEASGRYMELGPLFYVPSSERNLIQEGKAGHYVFKPGSLEMHAEVVKEMDEAYRFAYGKYVRLLDIGTAREIARAVLPVGLFSHMYATCNARSLMHFLGLRTISEGATFPSFPQREIEMIAEKMEIEWARHMPITYGAFCENGRVSP